MDARGRSAQDTSGPTMQPAHQPGVSSAQTNPPQPATMSPSEAHPGTTAGPSHTAAAVQRQQQAVIDMPESGAGSSFSSYDEERAQQRGGTRAPGDLKGMSPTTSQQLELDDALASAADLEGPTKPSSHWLIRCCSSCTHHCCACSSLCVR